MQKVKVHRYVSGKRPEYAPMSSSEEESEEEDFIETRKAREGSPHHHHHHHSSASGEGGHDDARLRRLKSLQQHRRRSDSDDEPVERVHRHRYWLKLNTLCRTPYFNRWENGFRIVLYFLCIIKH
jgi:microfibrillar-associated protein 1